MSTASALSAADAACCEDSISMEAKKTRMSQNKRQIAILCAIGAFFVVCLAGLFASAFVQLESPADCDESVSSETATTILAFLIGWASCFLVKHHESMQSQLDNITAYGARVSAFVSCSCSSIRSSVATIVRSNREWVSHNQVQLRKALSVGLVAVLFSSCIVGLVISAFTAVPGEEAAADGFASEASTTMKAFTFGWMSLMFYKLQKELVGEVGCSCFLQPC